MIPDLYSWRKFNGYRTIFRAVMFGLMLILAAFLVGCNTEDSSDDDDDDTPAGVWTLISIYNYDYNADDLLIREIDDNNANNRLDSGDVTWNYQYDSDDMRTGYLMYNGADLDPDGIGTYFYNIDGCNDRLEEETPQGTNLQVWTYEFIPGSDCLRSSYDYDGNGTTETGTYIRDDNDEVIELRLDNGDYWEYTLDNDGSGKRLRYDFYQDGTLFRYGIYDYTGSQLDELRNYEKR